MSILIKDATIITQNEKREILQGDILINGSTIGSVGKTNEKADEVIDASGKIAMPGLINAHTHVPMTALRGLGEDLPLQEWLAKKIWPAEAKLSDKDIYNGSLLGIAEMIRSGTTCFNEMYPKGMDEIAKACVETGIRGQLARGMLEYLPNTDGEKEFSDNEKFIRKWKGKNDLVVPVVSCHSAYMCSEELMVKAKKFANENDLKFHMHASETRKEIMDIMKAKKMEPYAYFDGLGLVDENSIFAHASWVTKREIALAGKKKLAIAHCPASNLKLATGGICPISEYDEQGANVTIGTDSAASNNSLNMFESMKLAALLQKHHYWDAARIKTQRIFDFATINGAKALGINAGSVEKGRLADIVLLDRNAPNLNPQHDLVANLVYSADPSNVQDVIINGKVVMRERELLTINREEFKLR